MVHWFISSIRAGTICNMTNVTQIMCQIEQGDSEAAEQLLPLVYDELRRLAAAKLAHDHGNQTLQTTALVHEAYVRLVDVDAAQNWNSRGHFFSAAAEAMRRILVDNARRKRALRRGGDRLRQNLDQIEPAVQPPSDDLIALDEAMKKLSDEDPAKAEVVKLRYFAGLTMEQIAQALGISLATANRHWSYARAWLYKEVSKGEEEL